MTGRTRTRRTHHRTRPTRTTSARGRIQPKRSGRTPRPVTVTIETDAETPTWRLIENVRRGRRRARTDADLSDVGKALRLRRAHRRISLDEAARETRIRRSYIEALEANAPIEAFPAPTYARAFLREYAGYLGLDPERILAATEALREQRPDRIAPLLPARPREEVAGRWPLRIVAAGALLSVALVVGGMETGRPRPKPSAPPVDLSAIGAPLAGVGSGEATSAPMNTKVVDPDTATAILIELRVEQFASWVRVHADDKPVFEGTLTPGTVRRFEATRLLRLIVGNAAAVNIILNGRPLEALGPRGQVRRLTFSLSDGTVSVTSSDSGSVVAAPADD